MVRQGAPSVVSAGVCTQRHIWPKSSALQRHLRTVDAYRCDPPSQSRGIRPGHFCPGTCFSFLSVIHAGNVDLVCTTSDSQRFEKNTFFFFSPPENFFRCQLPSSRRSSLRVSRSGGTVVHGMHYLFPHRPKLDYSHKSECFSTNVSGVRPACE